MAFPSVHLSPSFLLSQGHLFLDLGPFLTPDELIHYPSQFYLQRCVFIDVHPHKLYMTLLKGCHSIQYRVLKFAR